MSEVQPSAAKRPRREYELPEFAKFVRRLLRAYGRRIANADDVDLAEALQNVDYFELQIHKAVWEMRHGPRRETWVYIAGALGTTPSAAQHRWGKPPAE